MTPTQILLKRTKEFWLAMGLLQTMFVLIILSGAEPETSDILAVELGFIVMCAVFARGMVRERRVGK